MNEKFFDLKKEKQDRMINAALKVFAINGYQKASTDDIVKEAIAPYVDKVPQIMGEIMERADYSRIKDGVDTDLLVRTMYYVTRGLMEMALVTGMGPDGVLKEAVAYYEMMRSQFTKEDYL